MKRITKVMFLALALLLISTTIAAAGATVRYYKITVGETTDVNFGRAGVTFIMAYYSGKLKLTKINKDAAPGDPPFKVTQKPMDVKFINYKGEWQYEVNNAVYVYFKLRNTELDKWKDGKLSIYTYNHGTWKICPTYEVWGRYSGEMRVSCRMKNYGLYAVGLK